MATDGAACALNWALLTDLYALTMACGYWRLGSGGPRGGLSAEFSGESLRAPVFDRAREQAVQLRTALSHLPPATGYPVGIETHLHSLTQQMIDALGENRR
jgi:hypothetical protein